MSKFKQAEINVLFVIKSYCKRCVFQTQKNYFEVQFSKGVNKSVDLKQKYDDKENGEINERKKSADRVIVQG